MRVIVDEEGAAKDREYAAALRDAEALLRNIRTNVDTAMRRQVVKLARITVELKPDEARLLRRFGFVQPGYRIPLENGGHVYYRIDWARSGREVPPIKTATVVDDEDEWSVDYFEDEPDLPYTIVKVTNERGEDVTDLLTDAQRNVIEESLRS